MRELTSWEGLQALKHLTSESADLDFKVTLETDTDGNRIECAKDVAALANVLGGHIIVGASTEMNRTRCTGFHGVTKDVAVKVVKTFEEQVKRRCQPAPFIDVRVIDVPGKTTVVVVVAVEPSPTAPIGVSIRQDSGGHLVDEGFVLPVRVGSTTNYLQPDQFGAYESMTARRAAALLSGIPLEKRNALTLRWTDRFRTPPTPEQQPASLESISLKENLAVFRHHSGSNLSAAVPLDEIQSVWAGTDAAGQWSVALKGALRAKGPARWEYWAAG